MSDFEWPADLAPFQQTFYLQPHVTRSVSPFTRGQKVYELSAARWVTQIALRGGYDGVADLQGLGRRADAHLARLKGGVNRSLIYDFRREREGSYTNAAISAGATTVALTGDEPQPGDYLGGDGRPHIITAVTEESDGSYTASIEPPYRFDVAAGDAVEDNVTATFRLASDDAGANMTNVGEPVIYQLEFTEDLDPYPSTLDEDVLTFARAAAIPPEAAVRLDALVTYIKGLSGDRWADTAIIPSASDLNTITGGTMPVLGGWPTTSATVTGSPTMKRSGMHWPWDASDIGIQIELDGLQSKEDLSVFQAVKPLYAAGENAGSSQMRWSFGRTGVTRFMGRGVNSSALAGESGVLFYRNGSNEDRGHDDGTMVWANDDAYVEGGMFRNTSMRSWKDGTAVVIDLGGSDLGDFSPDGTGYTTDDLFNIGFVISSGTTQEHHFRGEIGLTVVISRGITDAEAAALSALIAETVITEPDVWKTKPGAEDPAGGFATNTRKLYRIGGDTNEGTILTSIQETDPTTGLTTTKSATLQNACYLQGHVWNESGGCFDMYGGRNAATAATATIESYFPETDTIETHSEVLPGATGHPAVARDPSGANRNFIFGGYQGGDTGIVRDWVLVHDKDAGTVTQVATMTYEAAGMFAFAMEGTDYIYFGGGFRNATEPVRDQNKLFRIHRTTYVIEACPDLPEIIDSAHAAYSSAADAGYLFGGYDDAGGGAGGTSTYWDKIIKITHHATAASVGVSELAAVMPQAQDDFTIGEDPVTGLIWLISFILPNAVNNLVGAQVGFAVFDPSDETIEMKEWS